MSSRVGLIKILRDGRRTSLQLDPDFALSRSDKKIGRRLHSRLIAAGEYVGRTLKTLPSWLVSRGCVPVVAPRIARMPVEWRRAQAAVEPRAMMTLGDSLRISLYSLVSSGA